MNSFSNHSTQVETDLSLVEAELDRLLAGKRFSGAPQMTAFLRYIVTETLKGNGDRIKAYSVGVDALGKQASFDAQTDPSVRVLALRLRKTLADIYNNCDEKPLAIIDLRVGTYVPEFYKAGSRVTVNDANTALQSVESGSHRVVTIGQPGKEAANTLSRELNTTKMVKSVGDEDTTAVPIPPGEYIHLDRNVYGTEAVSAAQVPELSRRNTWLLVGGLLFIALWLQLKVSVVESDLHGAYDHSGSDFSVLTASVASLTDERLPVETAHRSASTAPTIFLPLSKSNTDMEKRIMTMLSSSLVQAGTLRVVRLTDIHESRYYGEAAYTMMVDGFNVDDNFRMDAQVISLADGEMLLAVSVMIEGNEDISSGTLSEFQKMAESLASASGPLFGDYCARHSAKKQIDCDVL